MFESNKLLTEMLVFLLFKNTNIAYVRPHILRVKNNDYLIFEECDDIFINGYKEKIKFKDLEAYIKAN